jgi:hypothetical protein
VEVGLDVVLIVVAYLSYGLVHDRSQENAKVGAHYVHETDHGRVLAIVDDDVGVLEDEKRLQEYVDQAERFGDDGHGEGDLALGYNRVVVQIGLDHLNQAEAAIDHGANAEDGRAHAHIKLARAVLVVVCEVELGEVGAGRAL